MSNVLLVDGQEADQGEGPIQNRGAGGDLKVQGEEGLIPEREAEDLGAHPKQGNPSLNFIVFSRNEFKFWCLIKKKINPGTNEQTAL